VKDLVAFRNEDFDLSAYEHHPPIPAPVAV
jgi:thymidylate synthase